MIFKLQIDMADAVVLIYNEDQSLFTQQQATPELRTFFDEERPSKVFAYGKIVGENVEIGGVAPWQDW